MKARRKPVVIEFVQWLGDNFDMIGEFASSSDRIVNHDTGTTDLLIHTLEGVMVASEGDYIIKGVEGEIYPCKPGIFHQTYEIVDE